eukprot:m.1274026 g.1274026  ORF g.1274026 m.1274026 type:complete len:62 (+) comp24757_c0_seq1:38-223(+)
MQVSECSTLGEEKRDRTSPKCFDLAGPLCSIGSQRDRMANRLMGLPRMAPGRAEMLIEHRW